MTALARRPNSSRARGKSQSPSKPHGNTDRPISTKGSANFTVSGITKRSGPFRQIAAHDPECAMAYWGMAMANWENPERSKEFIEKANTLTEKSGQACPNIYCSPDKLSRRKTIG